MSIQPDGEDIRRAVKWIAQEREYDPDRPLQDLIQAACLEFDLSPMEAEYLTRTVR